MFLNNVTADKQIRFGYARQYPTSLMVYQICSPSSPALISGAIVETGNIQNLFLVRAAVVYLTLLSPLVWGRSWLQAIGSLDFAVAQS